MGTMVGHVGPGLGFFAIGLWHLINHIRLHSQNPKTYTSHPWFPSSFLSRYLELYLIMLGCCISISMELFIGPANHQPLDPSDWTIPSYHLHNFEHSSISLTFLVYAIFALLLDRIKPPSSHAMTQLLAALAFAQQLLMFHLHSTDHMGVEGQYHWLLQLVIAVSLTTTLMGIGYESSFVVSFVRSASIMFQGVWLFVMGIMLWTPEFIPKGCFLNDEGHLVVRCHGDEALHRAKSLVNIEFSWYLAGVAGVVVVLYVVMVRNCSMAPGYLALDKAAAATSSSSSEDDLEDLELQSVRFKESESFIHVGNGMRGVELER